MPLRLAGEDQAAVLGLDGQGWVREARSPDGGYSLKLPDAVSEAKGLLLGGDAVLYRNAPGHLQVGGASRLSLSNVYVYGVCHKDAGAVLLDSNGVDTWVYSANNGDFHMAPNGAGKIDCRARLYNSGATDGGALAMADALRVAGPVDAWDNLDSGSWQVALNPTERAAYFKFRTTDLDLALDGEGVLYLAEVGGVRKLVAKVKSGGVVYTGTLTLT